MMKGDLTKNLSRHEFACHCHYPECDRTPVDVDLPRVIQACGDHFARSERLANPMFDRVAIHINSGYRCLKHDRDIKGTDYDPSARPSEHLCGAAADHWMEYVYSDWTRIKISDDAIADFYELEHSGRYGIGRYNGRTHIDTARAHAARWDNR